MCESDFSRAEIPHLVRYCWLTEADHQPCYLFQTPCGQRGREGPASNPSPALNVQLMYICFTEGLTVSHHVCICMQLNLGVEPCAFQAYDMLSAIIHRSNSTSMAQGVTGPLMPAFQDISVVLQNM